MRKIVLAAIAALTLTNGLSADGLKATVSNINRCNSLSETGMHYAQTALLKYKNGIRNIVDVNLAKNYMAEAIITCEEIDNDKTKELASIIRASLKKMDKVKHQ